MSMSAEEAAAALARRIDEVRQHAAQLVVEHARACAEMMLHQPAPGSTPTKRAKREFAAYADATARVLAELKAAEEEMSAMAELIEARQGTITWQ